MGVTYVQIILVSLACGLGAGFFMHRSDFCVTAMFRDAFLFRDVSRLRILIFMVVMTMALFQGAQLLGLIASAPFPLLGPMSLANALAGAVFGIGMVLAGGCVVGTLYRMGSGSVLSLTAFAGLLAGSALYAEVHPQWAHVSKSLAVFGPGKTLPEMLNISPVLLIAPMILVGAFVVWRWIRQGALVLPSHAEGFIQPWISALVLAGIGLVSYVFVGMPLGITTSYAKLGATIEAWFAPEHVASLAYFQATPLTYTPPFADQSISGGAGPALDAIAAIQYPLVAGILLGSFASALLLKEFKVHYRMPLAQYGSALLGGVLVGLASRMVPGCNVWHLWGGLPILAGQSLMYIVGLIPGTWLGSYLLARYVIGARAA